VLIAETIDPVCRDWLRERCRVVEATPDSPAFDEALPLIDGLVVRTYTRVDEALLARCPRLKVVGRAGVGIDNIDVSACERAGVSVRHTPDANTEAVVEFTLALLLDAFRPRTRVRDAMTLEEWKRLRDALIVPCQIAGSTVGILGLGRIGKRIAAALAPLGARVLYHDLVDIHNAQRNGAAPVSLDALLRESDALTIHVDGRASNRNFLDAPRLALLRPEVVLVNTSRGFVIDEVALSDFLNMHPGARAMLDVHETEPVPDDSPLLRAPNAYLTPHIAAATAQAKRNMSWVVRSVWEALADQHVRH
jgi:phosphoglycerate dehydrogenase-like enzyme